MLTRHTKRDTMLPRADEDGGRLPEESAEYENTGFHQPTLESKRGACLKNTPLLLWNYT